MSETKNYCGFQGVPNSMKSTVIFFFTTPLTCCLSVDNKVLELSRACPGMPVSLLCYGSDTVPIVTVVYSITLI